MQMFNNIVATALLIFFSVSCKTMNENSSGLPWKEHGKLQVSDNDRYLTHEDGSPFLWLGSTAWGMTEWLSRESVDLYLDDRKSKGINVVQLCLFWGKRVDYPTKFTANAPNPYGHQAFLEVDGFPDASQPAVVAGGTLENPNDYWDHVDYCLEAIKKRGMYAAVLPFWGRRYVNATHNEQSLRVFDQNNVAGYGEFLGKRYGAEPHIIWVNGGDVEADDGGNFVPVYRSWAEGLIQGITGEAVAWNEESERWDTAFMTYHPSGAPMKNSSEWFHHDAWLDFNMIETHVSRDKITSSIRQDVQLNPPKPTIMAEGHYEGQTNQKIAEAIHIRRQAYQTFFTGAAGHTYGGGFDEAGNGPLFSPANQWKPLLDWEGASQLIHLRNFLEEHDWWNWQAAPEIIVAGQGEGELEKLATKYGNSILVYFPDHSECQLNIARAQKVTWYNTKNGEVVEGKVNAARQYEPPENFEDAVLVIR
jgi:hypothetical protein